MRRVAVVGAGISGIAAAHVLQDHAEVTLFEAEPRIGGHTDTHELRAGQRTCAVDSGFIVFNEESYPAFSRWLDTLGVASQPSDMSFGVSNPRTGLEYGTGDLQSLLARRRSALSPRFLGMLRDLTRFYRGAADVAADDDRSLARYLADEAYGRGFTEDHLLPLCAALWALPVPDALELPVSAILSFMNSHRLLQLTGRPRWRVVSGGSAAYLRAFQRVFRGTVHTARPVLRVARPPGRVVVSTRSGSDTFDAVVLACHSDQALGLLEDPTPEEREVLGAIGYRRSVAVVHSDVSVMPRRRSAWSSWNATVLDTSPARCEVTYWMNRLQSLDDAPPFFVTRDPGRELASVWRVRRYAQPVFTREARLAQRRIGDVSGRRHTHYCGAYWGWGSHEAGFASGIRAAQEILEEQTDAA